MGLDVRFAVISDLHIGLPHTIHDHPTRFHLVEWSISAFQSVLAQLSHENLDFMLLPGDLTQHGEADNHQWLSQVLATLPHPTYVIPGNHDVPVLEPDQTSIGWQDFPRFYRNFGYHQPNQLYYCVPLVPGLTLIGLNSNQFDAKGQQIGALDATQLQWLKQTLQQVGDRNDVAMIMVHHNVLEHFPAQTRHPIGQRYMLSNAKELIDLLRQHHVQLIFTGHLHVQDIASHRGIFDVTTGSLVSFPHPYRVVHLHHNSEGELVCQIQSGRVKTLPECEDVQEFSRTWMGDRSHHFMLTMLTQAPLNLSPAKAKHYAPHLRHFWATIADGDPSFHFPDFPTDLQAYFKTYEDHQHQPGEPATTDNNTTLLLKPMNPLP